MVLLTKSPTTSGSQKNYTFVDGDFANTSAQKLIWKQATMFGVGLVTKPSNSDPLENITYVVVKFDACIDPSTAAAQNVGQKEVMVHEVKLNFSKNTPVINIVVGDESSGSSSSRETETAVELEELDIDEPQLTELKKELDKRNGSLPIKGQTIKIKIRRKTVEVRWSWKIKCGLCGKLIVMRPDSNVNGRVNFFERHHYTDCISKRGQKRKSTNIRPAELFFEKVNSYKGGGKKEPQLVYEEDQEVIDDSYL